MKSFVYVLKSTKDGEWYTGYARNLKKRIGQHDRGEVFATKSRLPMELMYYEVSGSERDARARERYLKSGLGKRYIRNRLKHQLANL